MKNVKAPMMKKGKMVEGSKKEEAGENKKQKFLEMVKKSKGKKGKK